MGAIANGAFADGLNGGLSGRDCSTRSLQTIDKGCVQPGEACNMRRDAKRRGVLGAVIGAELGAILVFFLALSANAQTKPETWKKIFSPLNVTTAAAAFVQTYSVTSSVDAWSRRRNAALCLGSAPCPLPERNVIGLPWQKHGKNFAYVSTATGLLLEGYMAEQMRQSRHAWVRTIWWLPKVGIIAGSVFSTQYNLRHRATPPVPVISFNL